MMASTGRSGSPPAITGGAIPPAPPVQSPKTSTATCRDSVKPRVAMAKYMRRSLSVSRPSSAAAIAQVTTTPTQASASPSTGSSRAVA